MILLAVIAQLFATLGFGSRALKLLGLRDVGSVSGALLLSLALGYFIQSWLLFWMGLAGGFEALPIALLLLAGICVTDVSLYRTIWSQAGMPSDPTIRLLAIAGIAILAFYVVEGLAPPTDADTNGYHLAIPRQFVEAGAIFPIPRAIDGMAPLLIQTGYVPTLELAGLRAATLWYVLTGAAGGLAIYPLLRRALPQVASLLLALVALTTPAMVYGATSGQVEARAMIFVCAAAFALVEYRRSPRTGWLVAAAVLCGAYAGSKYLGLFFGVAMLVAVAVFVRRLPAVAAVAVCAAFAGAEWYGWNWYVTGDPVFPALADLLPGGGAPFWNADYAARFPLGIVAGEKAVEPSVLWGLAYPFVATFGGPDAFESGRTGLGPAAFLLLPVAAYCLPTALRGTSTGGAQNDAAVFLLSAAVFYVLWWFFGESQRIRHLLPVYPLVLAALAVLAARAWGSAGGVRALTAGLGLLLIVQIGGLAVHAGVPAKTVFGQVPKTAYLERHIVGYRAVDWINRNTPADSVVLLLERRNNAYLDRAYFRTNPDLESIVDTVSVPPDPAAFVSQIARLGTTHVLAIWWTNVASSVNGNDVVFREDVGAAAPVSGFDYLTYRLVADGCADIVHASETTRTQSRTLSASGRKEVAAVLALRYGSCCLPAAPVANGWRRLY